MGNLLKSIGWVGLGLIAALGAAGVAIFGSIGLEKVDSTLATTLRAIIMAAMLVAVTFLTGQLQLVWSGESNLDGRAWLFIVLAGLAGAISWLAYFGALKLGLASQVAALDRLSVAFVFVLSVFILGEDHTWRGWFGLALLVAGEYLIASD
ncbi:MAG: EamA family transporter [Ardenticatenaceae bacterium]|nr:EamA family transporter [Ardenticatenaceae bacterium]